jgi:glycosyltransferase involved in cell wall biosynthesis
MARHALEILSDDSRRREMGRRGREHAKARFCSSTIIKQYESYYEKVLNVA